VRSDGEEEEEPIEWAYAIWRQAFFEKVFLLLSGRV